MEQVQDNSEPISVQTEEIELLDMGAASVQTKGGRGQAFEGIDCLIRGIFLCP